MNSVTSVFRGALRIPSVRRLPIVLAAALIALFVAAPMALADGPLSLVTSINLGFRAHDIIFDGNFAYVATEKGLTILNITDLANPVLVGPAIAEPSSRGNRALGLAKRGNFVYLAAGKAGKAK